MNSAAPLNSYDSFADWVNALIPMADLFQFLVVALFVIDMFIYLLLIFLYFYKANFFARNTPVGRALFFQNHSIAFLFIYGGLMAVAVYFQQPLLLALRIPLGMVMRVIIIFRSLDLLKKLRTFRTAAEKIEDEGIPPVDRPPRYRFFQKQRGEA